MQRRQPTLIHVYAQTYELVLRERQGKAMADNIHGPFDLGVGEEADREVLGVRGLCE